MRILIELLLAVVVGTAAVYGIKLFIAGAESYLNRKHKKK